jgi:glycosyltransferase involved in cell wall biosynthesis
MKINFWTSTEYGGFMNALIDELGHKGVQSQQKFNISETSYRLANSYPQRLLLRFRQYIVYPLQLSLNFFYGALKGNANRPVVVATNTFFAPLLATFFNKRVVHLVYDLFPEAMIHSGKWEEGQWKVKFFRWLVGVSLRRSAINIFLGERLKKYVESIHGRLPNSEIIAVGADESPFPQLELLEDSKSISVLYCGNFGNMHESETLFDAWQLGINGSFQFLFHCSGPKRKDLELFQKKHKSELDDRLQVSEGLSNEEWIKVMQSSEIALVTMSEGAQEVVMPSKTYSAMMAGQAILAVAPEDSDLVDLIKAADCGWWVAPGDVQGFQECLSIIQSDRQLLLEKRQNAYRVAHEQFGQGCLAKQWVEVFESLQK